MPHFLMKAIERKSKVGYISCGYTIKKQEVVKARNMGSFRKAGVGKSVKKWLGRAIKRVWDIRYRPNEIEIENWNEQVTSGRNVGLDIEGSKGR
jgi:hypothetical protein